ncbi:MAG: GspE/PulE family protein, partial [Eubacteriales bacterium]|nr:GspE/PulE family protein [Eubacteriales bacterium]
MAYMRLGDLLVSVGLITEEQLAEALRLQKGSGKRLGSVLIEAGMISEKQLVETLELQLGISFIDLSKVSIPTEIAQLVPKNIAKRHSIVPVSLVRDELTIAMVDPLNFVAIEDVRAATRKRVTPRIATAEAVERAIATLYGNEGAARAIEEMKGAVAHEAPPTAAAVQEVDSESQSAPTVRLVNSIVERAAIERASDIHLEPQETALEVRMRVDGLLRPVLTVPQALQHSVISRIKIMGGMNIAEHRVPQDGRANVRVKGSDIDLRISTLPTIYGERAVIRLLDRSVQLLDAAAIGLTGENLEKYNALMRNGSGVVLISGPTGSGKSSTMYTMIRALNTKEVNLITLEDPVEYSIEGLNQVQINEKAGMTFASGLRAVLRQDPDIVAVGEIRDGETADIAMRAAITGHLVLSTIHTNDAIGTVERLLAIQVKPYLIADALKGVIAQRLVRRICPECR